MLQIRMLMTVAVFLSLPFEGHAERTVLVTATHEGKAVAGAEVCVYPARAADPLYTLQRPEVRCLPARDAIELPADRAFYVRHADRLIGPGDMRRNDVELKAGGHLLLSRPLEPNEQLVLIIGDGPRNDGMVIPVMVEDRRALVPADVPLITLLVRDGKPVWVAGRLQVGPGTEQKLVVEPSPSRGSSVLISFRGDDPFSEKQDGYTLQFLELLRKQDPPVVELLVAGGVAVEPEASVLRASNLFDNLYVFRSVPGGPATLRVSGRRFLTSETTIQVPETGVVVARNAGRIILGSQVVGNVAASASGMRPSPVDCQTAPESSENHERELVLWTCAQPLDNVQLSPAVLNRCTEAHRRTVPDIGDAVEFEAIAAGDFLLTLQRAGRITKIAKGTSSPGETTNVSIDSDEVFIAGRVTRDGEPVQAQVRFVTGEAATDAATGEYTALVSDLPGDHSVYVVACDESWVYVHMPKAEIPRGAGYDISIPANSLEVAIRDASTGEALDGVKLVALARPPEGSAKGGGQIPAEQRDDHYLVDLLEEGTRLNLCASLQNYKSKCTEITIVDRRQRVTLSLDRLAHRGRVSAPGYSMITWARADGTIVEQAQIDGEGKFAYGTSWTEGHAILTGTAPLFVTTARALDADGELNIAPPPAGATKAVRFSIGSAHPQEKVVLGVWVNGLRVPTSVFGMHQNRRRQPFFVTRTRPLVIQDLYASDVLSVVPGPDIDFLPRGGGLDNPMIFAGRAPIVVSGAEFVIE